MPITDTNPQPGLISEQLIHEIEQASFRAWPALEEEWLDGWLMRFSRGFTKRANSVNIFAPVTLENTKLSISNQIQACERWYSSRRQNAIFRLIDRQTKQDLHSSLDIDALLAKKGYVLVDPSLVLVKMLDSQQPANPDISRCEQVSLSEWTQIYQHVSDSSDQMQQLHNLILQGIQKDTFHAVARNTAKDLACGLGVLDGPLLGLFDLITHPLARRKGIARNLVDEICYWASRQGAQTCYLQVQQNNAPARSLYTAMGFKPAYRYWYRVSPPSIS